MAHQLKIYLIHNNKKTLYFSCQNFTVGNIYILRKKPWNFSSNYNRFSCAKNMNIEQSCLEDFEIHYRNGNRNNETRFYHNPYTNNNIIWIKSLAEESN